MKIEELLDTLCCGDNEFRRDFIAQYLIDKDAEVGVMRCGTTENIIVSFGSTKPPNCPKVIIGAHYDVIPNTPGANDNTAACISLMKLAEDLVGQERDLAIVFFDKEEPIHQEHGSLFYGHMIAQHGHPDLAIVLDVCGVGDTLYASALLLPEDQYEMINSVVPIGLKGTPHSDNLHLHNAGIQSVLLSVLPKAELFQGYPKSWGTMHTQADNPASVSAKTIKMVQDAMKEIVLSRP